MFKHMFAVMNEMLDHIIANLDQAKGNERQELLDQLAVLKSMSDTCIEEWLLFEEKMGVLHPKPATALVDAPSPALGDSQAWREAYERGHGFLKLLMFEQSIEQFEEAVRLQPDFLPARFYLALCYMQHGDTGEAYRHFQFIIQLSGDSRLKAVAYNAMGCIQVKKRNLEKAVELFMLAHEQDPDLDDPIRNMQVLTGETGSLQMGSGFPH
ncbi:hypothetical protein DUZ99_11005 [Xylanibacillus composti]|uniref:Tetratricopeptide repeat protein n=1 Tax=Xylanibacillus composti TaxID=1572762 RepID=A0A8J4GYK7_9BACL|nr:hypothetical protein [Xylanibacillus composti]MDT9725498.1 hypothetical protein [Xylanibacillus composti]GIQ67592.1 hypothetical protein XYCOK13_04160 [Xylanibacillus composti]